MTSDIGQLWITRITDPLSVTGGRYRIDQADPVIHITAEILNEFRNSRNPAATIQGNTLIITGENRTVRYTISKYNKDTDSYLCAIWQ
jgi:hypothetical protein